MTVRYVTRQQQGLPPGLANPFRGDFGVSLLLREVGQCDVGALPRVGDGYGAADAGVTSGD
jgi:hypothetical protein